MKSLRRTGLPVMLSEGFNPHPRLSFAMPLSVGHTGGGEFFEVDLRDEIEEEEFKRVFNEFAPLGIRVLEVKKVVEKQESMSSVINSGKYLLDFNNVESSLLQKAIDEILGKEEIIILKKSKRKIKETDIRSYIYDIVMVEVRNGKCVLEASIAQGGTKNLRVQDLLNLFSIQGIPIEEVSIEREGLYVKQNDKYFDLIEILTNVG